MSLASKIDAYAQTGDPQALADILRQLACLGCSEAATGGTGAAGFTRYVAVWTGLADVPIGDPVPLTFSENVLGATHVGLGLIEITLASPAPEARSTWGFGANIAASPPTNTTGGALGLVHTSDTVKILAMGPRQMQTARVNTDGAGAVTFENDVDVASAAIVGNTVVVTLTGRPLVADVVGGDNSGGPVTWSFGVTGPSTLVLSPFDDTGTPIDPATTSLAVSFLVVRQMQTTDLDGAFFLDTY